MFRLCRFDVDCCLWVLEMRFCRFYFLVLRRVWFGLGVHGVLGGGLLVWLFGFLVLGCVVVCGFWVGLVVFVLRLCVWWV